MPGWCGTQERYLSRPKRTTVHHPNKCGGQPSTDYSFLFSRKAAKEQPNVSPSALSLFARDIWLASVAHSLCTFFFVSIVPLPLKPLTIVITVKDFLIQHPGGADKAFIPSGLRTGMQCGNGSVPRGK